jgi:hypothetical protein
MVRNCLKTLDSGFRRNDGKWYFLTFYETIIYRSIQRRTSGGREYLTFAQQYVGARVGPGARVLS